MKTTILFACTLAFMTGSVLSQTANNSGGGALLVSSTALPSSSYEVVDVGPHHRVWQWETYETLPNGEVRTNKHSYRELASGLNYQDANGNWVASKPTIQAYSGGALAQQGQHKVIFANNLNTVGAIDAQMPDGNRLQSTVLGLLYSDPSTGQSVQIAALQDSEGELVADDEVLYPSALVDTNSGVEADVLYKNRIDGIEQNIVLKSQLPDPEAYGMNPATTYLGVFTEFFRPPTASVTNLLADSMGQTDEAIGWGKTILGRGKAFALGSEAKSVRVIKRYDQSGGRYFLLEKVRYQDILQSVSGLPGNASNVKPMQGLALGDFKYPKAPGLKTAARPMRMAMGKAPGKGYVLDYTSLSTAYTNYTFQEDTTYYISGALTLAGSSNVFEGGTVIKYTNGAAINFGSSGGAIFTSTSYHSVVFTAKDDNSIGDIISGSTGAPTNYYANPALNLGGATINQLANFRISYAQTAIEGNTQLLTVSDAQCVNCGVAFMQGSAPANFNNALFLNTSNVFQLAGRGITALNNVTVDNALYLFSPYSLGGLAATNCIFANVTNVMVGGTNYSGYIYAIGDGFYKATEFGSYPITNSTFPFQAVGGGNCYLATNSTFLTAGFTGIPAAYLADLTNRTVYPPFAFPAAVMWSNSLNLSPIIPRDNGGTLAIGYHYAPLDYVFGYVYFTNAIVTVNPGTCIGMFSTNYNEYGMSLAAGSEILCQGLANNLIHIAEYNAVQESYGGWLEPTVALVSDWPGGTYGGTPQPIIYYNFVDSTVMASDSLHLYFDSSNVDAVRNSQFHGGTWETLLNSVNVTNCLFERTFFSYSATDGGMPSILNNLFWNGTFKLQSTVTNTLVQNNLFDSTAFMAPRRYYPSQTTNAGYNGYVTNCGTLKIVYPTDVFLSNSPTYQTSWLGKYYLPPNSPLINAGSTTADKFGLYQFTTQTNQVKETNSIVDIGNHYVATDAYGNPIDINGDGIPDYLEDANGNGIFDAGDLSDWIISPYGLNSNSKIVVFTPLK